MEKLKSQADLLRENIIYEVVFVLLAIVSISLLLYEALTDLPTADLQRIIWIDFGIALLFLTDYFLGMFIAKDNKRYFKENWYLLLASIPVNEYLFRSLRILRVIRIVRILRMMRITSSVSRSLYLKQLLPKWFRRLKDTDRES